MEYEEGKRGKIINRERARQIIDFSGLRYKNITPTDIDGYIEYKDKAIILIEYKFDSNELPKGQRLALERMINDCEIAGKMSLLIVAEHKTEDCSADVDAANAKARALYYKGNWYKWGKSTVSETVNEFIKRVDDKIPDYPF